MWYLSKKYLGGRGDADTDRESILPVHALSQMSRVNSQRTSAGHRHARRLSHPWKHILLHPFGISWQVERTSLVFFGYTEQKQAKYYIHKYSTALTPINIATYVIWSTFLFELTLTFWFLVECREPTKAFLSLIFGIDSLMFSIKMHPSILRILGLVSLFKYSL